MVNFTSLRPVCGGARTCNDGSSLNGLKVVFSSSRQDWVLLLETWSMQQQELRLRKLLTQWGKNFFTRVGIFGQFYQFETSVWWCEDVQRWQQSQRSQSRVFVLKTRLTAAARDLKHAAAATKKSKKKVAHLRSERTVNGPTSSKRLLAVARGLFARSQLSV